MGNEITGIITTVYESHVFLSCKTDLHPLAINLPGENHGALDREAMELDRILKRPAAFIVQEEPPFYGPAALTSERYVHPANREPIAVSLSKLKDPHPAIEALLPWTETRILSRGKEPGPERGSSHAELILWSDRSATMMRRPETKMEAHPSLERALTPLPPENRALLKQMERQHAQCLNAAASLHRLRQEAGEGGVTPEAAAFLEAVMKVTAAWQKGLREIIREIPDFPD